MPISLAAAPPKDLTIYEANKLSQKPEYPEGMNAFYHLVGKNFRMPDEDVKGKIFASFVIEADGSLAEPKIIHDIGFGTGAELIRVLRLSEKWIPGELEGRPVRMLYSLPINIQGPTR